jgi:probable rRNA maturation factor
VDSATDVLAFALEEAPDLVTGGAGRVLGDVVVAVDVAMQQADARGHDLDAELALLAVHGLLHLLGEDHDTPARKAQMWARQAQLLRGLGFDGPAILAPEDLEMPVKMPSATKRRRGTR